VTNILIVDDTPEIVRLLELSLADQDYQIISAGSGRQALSILRDGFVGPILLDLGLPDYAGLRLFNELRSKYEGLPIIIITAHGTVDMALEATRLGAFDFLIKDDAFTERVFVSTKNAVAQLELRRKLTQLSSDLQSKYRVSEIISVSSEMQGVFDLMSHAMESRVTVLIQGESGTGKELIARALHYNGPRSSGLFVPVNCSGIPDTLLESELFGHEKGAFTSAVTRKIGKFELADGGTVFLDEIGEMPLALQAKLLRVLQEREVERLGGNQRIPIDIRVVCATNRVLQDQVQAGAFREDLYYRLAVFPITVPPLRERTGDIPIIAHHFLERLSAEEGKSIEGFEHAVLAMLMAHDYPGNVRELDNLIRHAVVVCSGPRIRVTDLPVSFQVQREDDVYDTKNAMARLESMLSRAVRSVDDIPRMKEVEERMIEHAMVLCDGNVVKAAKHLGISRATIYRRIEKMGLRR
jgi:two-component system response regulator AtoC